MEEDAAAAASSSGSAAPNDGGSGGVDTTAADDNHRNSIQKSRPDYLTSLLSGRTPSLRLESSQDGDSSDDLQKTTSDVDGSTTTTTSPRRPSRAELSKRLTSMRNSIKKLQQNNTTAAVIENVQVKLHNYSYHVPIRIDAPSIKTVFNQSPCYVVSNFMVNVGELITGERKVSYIYIFVF
jgi:hypothetical protein